MYIDQVDLVHLVSFILQLPAQDHSHPQDSSSHSHHHFLRTKMPACAYIFKELTMCTEMTGEYCEGVTEQERVFKEGCELKILWTQEQNSFETPVEGSRRHLAGRRFRQW